MANGKAPAARPKINQSLVRMTQGKQGAKTAKTLLQGGRFQGKNLSAAEKAQLRARIKKG